jgi:endonuclease YncB( thermonuclease family)
MPLPQSETPSTVAQLGSPDTAPAGPPPPAIGPDIVGRAHVTDGDTIRVSGVSIRLHGIDAPERNQGCGLEASFYSCGAASTQALKSFLGDQIVRCRPTDQDRRYNRVVAICYLNGMDTDINAWLITQGLAVAFRRYSLQYVALESAARAAKRGLWASSFEMPWDYRSQSKVE